MKYFFETTKFYKRKGINDTHVEDLCFTELSTKFIETQGWLPLTFFTCLHNQLSSF